MVTSSPLFHNDSGGPRHRIRAGIAISIRETPPFPPAKDPGRAANCPPRPKGEPVKRTLVPSTCPFAAPIGFLRAVRGEFFKDIRPVDTVVAVSGFINPEWLLEIEADAVIAPG